MSFDVRFISPREGQVLSVRCRSTRGDHAYRFEFRPEARSVLINRVDGDANNAYQLSGEKISTAIRRGDTNHVEIS